MPFIFIGTGGMGKETVARIKQFAESAKISNAFYLGFDIDSTLVTDGTADIPLPNICVERPFNDIRALEERNDKEFFSWWPKGHTITTSLSGSSGAGQVRINGKFALFSRYDVISRNIDNVIKSAKDISKKDPNDNIIYVFLISSLGGGTGAGIFIDMSFLIRKMLGDDQRFYGVFYDGTITKAYSRNTLDFAYASLGEIEYWLQNFRSFEMTYGHGERQSGEHLSKLFDLVFLIQAETGDGKRFVTADNKCPYIPMVAEALFTLLSTRDFRQFTISNSWNRFDNLNNNGMQIRYASFGIGSITYAEEEVRSYVVHDLIKKFILSHTAKATEPMAGELEHAEAPQSFEELIEKPFMISEREDQSLTSRVLHSSSKYGPLMSRVDNFKKKVGGTSKTAELQQLRSQYKIPLKTTDSLDEWDTLFSSYSEDIKKILLGKRIQCVEKIEEAVTRLGKECSVDASVLSRWLDEALGVIEKNEEFVKKHKNYPDRKTSIESIGKTWTDLFGDKKWLGGLKVEYKIKLSSAVDKWMQSELASIELPAIRDFYASLKDVISKWKVAINIFQDQIRSVQRKIDVQIGKYTSRDVAYNLDSLASNEFPLHIKLDINKALVDTFVLKERILDQKEIRHQLESLGDVIYSGNESISGIAHYFRLISKEVFEGREQHIRGDGGIAEGLYCIFYDAVQERVSFVLNEIGIDDILEYWLRHQLYPVAKKFHGDNNKAALLDLKQRWAMNFGESAADILVSSQYFGDAAKEDEWFEVALRNFVLTFKSKIRAFVRHGNQIKWGYWDKINLSKDSRNAFADKVTVFVPEKFRFSGIIREGSEESIIPSKSGHNKIRIFAETYAFPLHSLDLVQGYQEHRIREGYLQHRDLIRDQIQRGVSPSLLIHIDKRFYTEWPIDIGSDETSDLQGYWIYILGMGLDIIWRDEKKKFVWQIGENRGTLDKTLPGALEKIRQDYELRDSLRVSCIDRIKKGYYGAGNLYGAMEDVARNAYKKHAAVKPVRTGATENAYLVWAEIESWIRPREDGSFPPSSRVPKSWEEMERLLAGL